MSIKVRYTPEEVKPKTAVIYLRVSTEEQVDNFSLWNGLELSRDFEPQYWPVVSTNITFTTGGDSLGGPGRTRTADLYVANVAL